MFNNDNNTTTNDDDNRIKLNDNDNHIKSNDDDNHTKLNDNNDEHPLNVIHNFFTSTIPSMTISLTNSLSELQMPELQMPSLQMPSVFPFGNEKSCTIKLIHINDVYELDYLAHYATCKQWESSDKTIGISLLLCFLFNS